MFDDIIYFIISLSYGFWRVDAIYKWNVY